MTTHSDSYEYLFELCVFPVQLDLYKKLTLWTYV